ncbi:CNH-domain-containing protein [Rhizodiscina lignyota]|uniref:CNH-domain-containing protein n=1 Tax=Rhizodiscina lignyota TaxID=1504668 RepID=A0A9P4MBH3_9PEZI|nr:CNH-domain-containing protein [Rhizodiscina lignyota]
MADYSPQQAANYGRNYGHAGGQQRDAAFAHIFGAAPPGRSQTMTSQTFQSSPERAQTMAAATPDVRAPRPPPVRQHINGYGPSGPPQRSPDQPPPPRQPNPQYLPHPTRPDRQPYGQPQRLDHRSPPSNPLYNRPVPNRYPGPSLNTDPFRSQSMATGPRPNIYPGGNPGGNQYNNIAPAHTFRQQPYMRTTAQGRMIPERPDERTMSMSNYGKGPEHNQTMSGRVIPNRRSDASQEILDSPTSPISKPRSGSQASIPGRTMSMASTVVASDRTSTMTTNTALGVQKSNSQSQTLMVRQRGQPLVYPALLSKVADVFRERINLAEKAKDGLDYKMAFSGAEAVDVISYIIRTTDRNLALLLGRSLDAQKFFHDVTYAHRLRDSQNEIYQFRETLVEDQTEVNGVFTLLTECYSPTCTPFQLCYSIACPRRLEQQAKLNMKPQPGLKREDSRQSLHEDQGDEQKLWINTVSKEVSDSVGDKEKKRQEVISELMYTERDFVKDLEYVRDFWQRPLRDHNSPIPEHRREKFVRTVFSNIQEVYKVNSKLAEALTRRQQQSPVVHNVGDIFLQFVPNFAPFITYGRSQLFGKYEFENEKRSNNAFSRFVDETERLKESRKLELNGYLTKPTTRLARYPLLLENILKYTAEDNPDREHIPEAIKLIKEFLQKVNIESGKAENHFNLQQLNRDLKFRPGEYVDLKLTEEARQLVFKGTLKKSPTDSSGDIQAYLFDHAVLLVRTKMVNKREELKVYRKPIPLELLVVAQMEEIMPRQGIARRGSTGLMGTRTNTMSTMPRTETNRQQGHPLTFKHLGKGGYELTLYCTTPIQQTKWLEHIDEQQRKLKERSEIFTKTILNEGFFTAAIRVNCCVPIDGGRKLIFGTDTGIYISDRKPKDASIRPKRVLDCKNVTQIDVLEQHQIVLVLSEKTMYSYPTEALEPDESNSALTKRGRKICHANFFKAGICQGQQLVCCVKTSALSTTIKVYEPMDSMMKTKKKSGLAKMLASSQDVLKPLKEFYIPTESTSIHFLRSKLCVGCARGFEVVSLETLEAQSLLDQADTSLDFVQRKENIKPIHIERIATEFLLCYTDYSFFVNRNGWRARSDWMIYWEGNPQAFAIFNPYILAFEPSFVEIRHMETGMLVHILTAKNIRMLHSSSREILYAYEDELGNDIIASLDFWGRPQSPQGHRPQHSIESNGR